MNKSICTIIEGVVKHWVLDGKYHREDGPAIEYATGERGWCINGLLHRLDGPAIEGIDGRKYWYFHGKYINCNSQEEFERLIRLKAFW